MICQLQALDQVIIRRLDGNALRLAQDHLVNLAHRKKYFYVKVYENEHILCSTTIKFDAANGF